MVTDQGEAELLRIVQCLLNRYTYRIIVIYRKNGKMNAEVGQ